MRRTVEFYQGVLGFPLIDMFENRDLPGSTHFFFDVGNGNTVVFFDLPGVDVGPYAEVLGGLHHLAISMEPQRWQQVRDRMDPPGVSGSGARCVGLACTVSGSADRDHVTQRHPGQRAHLAGQVRLVGVPGAGCGRSETPPRPGWLNPRPTGCSPLPTPTVRGGHRHEIHAAVTEGTPNRLINK